MSVRNFYGFYLECPFKADELYSFKFHAHWKCGARPLSTANVAG